MAFTWFPLKVGYVLEETYSYLLCKLDACPSKTEGGCECLIPGLSVHVDTVNNSDSQINRARSPRNLNATVLLQACKSGFWRAIIRSMFEVDGPNIRREPGVPILVIDSSEYCPGDTMCTIEDNVPGDTPKGVTPYTVTP